MLIAESNVSSFFDRMRWVVLDEADLLMGGGFQRDVNAILAAMRDEDTHSKAEIISAQLGISVDSFYAKPRGERKRILQGKAMPYRGHYLYVVDNLPYSNICVTLSLLVLHG